MIKIVSILLVHNNNNNYCVFESLVWSYIDEKGLYKCIYYFSKQQIWYVWYLLRVRAGTDSGKREVPCQGAHAQTTLPTPSSTTPHQLEFLSVPITRKNTSPNKAHNISYVSPCFSTFDITSRMSIADSTPVINNACLQLRPLVGEVKVKRIMNLKFLFFMFFFKMYVQILKIEYQG